MGRGAISTINLPRLIRFVRNDIVPGGRIPVTGRWILVFERGPGLNGLTKNSEVIEFLSGVGETT